MRDIETIDVTADRCDICQHQAYVLAESPKGGELTFCAHHGRMLRADLKGLSWRLAEDREALDKMEPTDGAQHYPIR